MSTLKKPTARAREWLTDEGLTLIGGWAMQGLNDEQIAHNMGIARSTFYAWKNDYKDFSDVLKKNKEVADFEIVNALYESAKNGNTTAMIFWLKNRMPKQWRDRPDNADGGADYTVEIINDVD